MKKLRLLIVDDEHRIGMLISKLIHFDELPLTLIDVFDNSELALKKIIDEKPDIVISDIQMPILDGLQLIEKVQAENIFPHFILISGYREFEYARQALKFGIEDYLLKPVKEDELNEVLKKVWMSHKEELKKEIETKKLQETAIREHKLSGKDALLAIENNTFPSTLEEANQEFNLHFKKGKFSSIALCLDEEESEEENNVENRLLLNTLIGLIENRLQPTVYEQMYYIKEDVMIIGLINYADINADYIQKELQTAFIDVDQHTSVMPKKIITMAIGDVGKFEDIYKIVKSAKDRLIQRLILGTGICISGTEVQKEMEIELSNKTIQSIQNALTSFDQEALKDTIDYEYESLEVEKASARAYYALSHLIVDTIYKTTNDLQSLRLSQLHKHIDCCYTRSMLKKFVINEGKKLIEDSQNARQAQAKKPIRQAQEYIASHYSEKITLEDVCEELDMNPSYFSSLFKKETGENFQNYLTMYRIEKAKELLRDTNDTMLSIAYKVGYTDTRYFSQTFTKIVGMKPSLYRKMYA